jgi:hypothetical protein
MSPMLCWRYQKYKTSIEKMYIIKYFPLNLNRITKVLKSFSRSGYAFL